MKLSIAVYPSNNQNGAGEQEDAYLDLAGQYGYTEVFTSLHLPEIHDNRQIDNLEFLAKRVKKRGMELTVDVGGSGIARLLASEEAGSRIKEAEIDFIRLDYGFLVSQAAEMVRQWNLRGLVVNASIYSEEEIHSLLDELRSIRPQIEIRACHNFYPRPETGEDEQFFNRQNSVFTGEGVPVYACLPSFTNPRPPLRLGLPTLEKHRYMDLSRAACELRCSLGIGGIMAADEFFSEVELQTITSVVNFDPWKIEVKKRRDITLLEEEILEGSSHHFRYDSNSRILRSASSREMAEYAKRVPARNMERRPRGTVIIDNENYVRYSGELQVVLEDMPADERVNCIGRIQEKDMWKFEYFRKGYDYCFL